MVEGVALTDPSNSIYYRLLSSILIPAHLVETHERGWTSQHINQSIHLFTYPSIHLSIYHSIYLKWRTRRRWPSVPTMLGSRRGRAQSRQCL